MQEDYTEDAVGGDLAFRCKSTSTALIIRVLKTIHFGKKKDEQKVVIDVMENNGMKVCAERHQSLQANCYLQAKFFTQFKTYQLLDDDHDYNNNDNKTVIQFCVDLSNTFTLFNNFW